MTQNLLSITPLVDVKIISESLTRIGVADKEKHILYPSCYLYIVNDFIYLVHFKQMFILTRPDSYNNISDMDIQRRNAIAGLLKQWKLIDVDDQLITPREGFIFVLPYSQKHEWEISHKFNMNTVKV